MNEIQVKHLNRVSEVETTKYIRDHLFYGLRKPLWESICAKFDNPLNDYMALMWAARKGKGKHEQEKHNTSYASKSGIVSEVASDQAGNDNQDTKASMQKPWPNWVKMQQQLMAAVTGAQSALKNPQQGSNRGQRRNSQSTSTSSQRSQWQGNSQNSDTARNNQMQTRRGNDQNQIQCYNCQGGAYASWVPEH